MSDNKDNGSAVGGTTHPNYCHKPFKVLLYENIFSITVAIIIALLSWLVVARVDKLDERVRQVEISHQDILEIKASIREIAASQGQLLINTALNTQAIENMQKDILILKREILNQD